MVDVTEDIRYPQPVTFIAFDGIKTKLCEGLSEYKEGDYIEINFNLRGKESAHYPGKYLTNLEIWKTELINKEANK